MVRTPLPESRLRARKRTRLRVLSPMLGGLALAAIGGLTYLSWRPFLRIQEVRIEGAQTIATSTLERFVRARLAGTYLGVLPRDNVFIYPKSRVERDLRAAYPLFADVSVAADSLTSLVVALAERGPVALWCGSSPAASEPCLYLDESGMAYAQAPAFSGAPYARHYGVLPEGPLPRQFLAPDRFRSLLALVEAMKEKTGEIERVSVSADDVSAVLGGFIVKFTLAEDPADVFRRFALALGSAPFSAHKLSDFQYLDLRFGDKLYYKLK